METVRIAPAPRSVIGRLCIRNSGPGPLVLEGTDMYRRAVTRVGHRRSRGAVALRLLEASDLPLARRLGRAAGRVGAWRPGFVGRPTILVLGILAALLLAVGVPVAWVTALKQPVAAPASGAEPGPPPAART